MKFKITKDGQTCKLNIEETSKGVKFTTQGKSCRKMLGKDYFKKLEMGEFE